MEATCSCYALGSGRPNSLKSIPFFVQHVNNPVNPAKLRIGLCSDPTGDRSIEGPDIFAGGAMVLRTESVFSAMNDNKEFIRNPTSPTISVQFHAALSNWLIPLDLPCGQLQIYSNRDTSTPC